MELVDGFDHVGTLGRAKETAIETHDFLEQRRAGPCHWRQDFQSQP